MRLAFVIFPLGLALSARAQTAPVDSPPHPSTTAPLPAPVPSADAPDSTAAAPESSPPAPTPEPTPASPTPSPAPAAASDTPPSTDDIFAVGQSLFDQFAPPEIKEQFEFPSQEQWDDFVAHLERALAANDLADLARYEPQARAALIVLRTLPGGEEYADWLNERLDYIQAAKELTEAATPATPPPPAATPSPRPAPAGPPIPSATPPPPAPPASAAPSPAVPHYDLWLKRMQDRPTPTNAGRLMPRLRAAFAAEGVPPQLAWLAEVESTLNPAARSPTGARGLFQMMPATAKHLGLSTFLPDERTDPEKSAHAAARYLKTLHARFGTWPLALAAYNAGEGRVARALAARHGDTFAQIASTLPVETRMYVPKVCALVAVRTGTPANQLSPPRA